MVRVGVRLLAAVLAFGLGLLAHSARRRVEQSQSSNPVIEQQRLPSEDFVGTGLIDMFMEDYRRESDGAYVRFGCSVCSSEAAALVLVRSVNSADLVQKTDVLDIRGSKIGEREVTGSGEPASGAVIEWNEGSRLFYIQAPSVADAITFENSKVWVGSGCWDFSSFLIRTPPPNKRLERTRQLATSMRSCVGEPLKRNVLRYDVIVEVT